MFSLCVPLCAGCRRSCSGKWVLVGKSLFPWRQQLSAISVSSQDFPPPPVLLLRSKVACYSPAEGGEGSRDSSGGRLGWGVPAGGEDGAGSGWVEAVSLQKPGSTVQCGFSVDRSVGWVPACPSLAAAGSERGRAEASRLELGPGSPLCCCPRPSLFSFQQLWCW